MTKPYNEQVGKFFAKYHEVEFTMLTYDDVRLHTNPSEVMPSQVRLDTRFSRNINLRIPIVSAAMDTVTESEMAIAMASCGGIGVIHKNMTPEVQSAQVERVKFHLNGRIEKPISVTASESIADVLQMRERRGFSFHSFLVLDENRKLVGLLTRHDFDLVTDTSTPVRDVMTPLQELITAPEGTTLTDAAELMRTNKKKLIPLVYKTGEPAGLYVHSDIRRIRSGSMHNVDSMGHLRVAAAVGVGGGALTRAALLSKAGCDAFVIDTAHGDTRNVTDTIAALKSLYPNIDIVAGNVSRGEAARRLVEAGADGVIVGQGGGSICTTRVVAGVGCPQVSAVYDCVDALRETDVPVTADGGIRNSGDIVIALAIGAHSVVLGRGLAGTKEAPGGTRMINGILMKEYRGMASEAALQSNAGSRERYRQSSQEGRKLVPEGIESFIPFTGSVSESLENFIGGVQNGCGYLGAENLEELVKRAQIFRITAAGLRESHPHDVTIAREASNYVGR